MKSKDIAKKLKFKMRSENVVVQHRSSLPRIRVVAKNEVGFRLDPCPLEVIVYPFVFADLVKPFVKAPMHAKVMDMKKMIRSRLQERGTVWNDVLNETRKPKSRDLCIYVKQSDEEAFELADNLTLGELRRNYWDDDKELRVFFGRVKAVRTWVRALDISLVPMEFSGGTEPI